MLKEACRPPFWSGSPGLNWLQAEQREPMRVALSGHQLGRTLADTLGARRHLDAPARPRSDRETRQRADRAALQALTTTPVVPYNAVMTRFSPPIIRQCPGCAGYFRRHAPISLHFYDDVPEWSDGKNGQWWAGAGGHVGRCPACSKTVWIDDAAEVMRLPWKPNPMGTMARSRLPVASSDATSRDAVSGSCWQ